MNARVICRDCNMETGLDPYQDQIEEWKENCCDLEFKEVITKTGLGQDPDLTKKSAG